MSIIFSPHTIGICGLGQIGLPLALTCWRSGYRALLFDYDRQKVEAAPEKLKSVESWMVRELPEYEPSYGELEYINDVSALNGESELILECIWEEMTAKVALLQALSGAGSRGAIFCSCTSGLSITELGVRSGFPAQTVGTHFWSPPHLMPLVDVVKGSGPSAEAMAAVSKFCQSLGKHPVRVNIDVPGFVGNRMLHALWREAIEIVERGIASLEDVDTVAKLTFGLRQVVLGPMEHMDLAGLDLIYGIHEYLLADLSNNQSPGRLLKDQVQAGNLGLKTGRGFYDWRRRDAAALIEARDQHIVRELKRLNQARRKAT